MKEFGTDAVVEPDAARDVLHIGARLLAQIGNLVDERHLHGEEGVGRIFGELGSTARGEHQRRPVEIERTVDLAERAAAALIIDADDDPVGMLEIGDRGAFAQKLRIGRDGEIQRQDWRRR